MPAEPPVKRAVAFIDGQNLFHGVKSAFGHTYPNYDVGALTGAICASKGWQVQQIRFYTGVPDTRDNAFWNGFWAKKLLAMSRTALIFSQDQDLSEAADEVRVISAEQNRWIKVACAFPDSPAARNHRGINNTDWIRIDRASYDACIDPRDYRT